MGRELRQRKAVTYNESLLSAEVNNAAAGKDAGTGGGGLLKFTRQGISNTSKGSAFPESLKAERGRTKPHRSHKRLQRRRYATDRHSTLCISNVNGKQCKTARFHICRS